jgi:hypothetical protein
MIQPWPIQITALTPAACGAISWHKAGKPYITVIVKATFDLVHGQSATLATPREVVREDRYREHTGSLEEASDMALYLPSAGVILRGHAHAPGGRAAPTVAARLAVLRERPLLDKTVHVFGDRASGASHAQPFTKIPLVYERAYGGVGTPENPTGVGAPGTAAQPNIVDPTRPHQPAGFGPISRYWPARRGWLGGRDASELLASNPAVPEGFDWRYFHAAPPDQQTELLRGDEWIVLDGMHPSLPRVQSRLPSAVGRARWQLATASGLGPLQAIDLAADTLFLDADRLTGSVVWRGRITLERPDLLPCVRVFAGVELIGQPINWARSQITSGVGLEIARTIAAPSHLGSQQGLPSRADPAELASTSGLDLRAVVASILPFAAPDPWRPSPAAVRSQPAEPPPRPRGSSPLGATADADMQQAMRAILPFRGTPQPFPGPTALTAVPAPVIEPPAMLPEPPRSWPDPAVPVVQTPPLAQPPPAYSPSSNQEPPPFMGTPGKETASSTPPIPVLVPEPASEPEPPGEPALPLASYPLERCAAIAGSIARRKVDKAAILATHGLTPDQWARLDGHWREAIQQETQRGKATLLRAHDSAYVGQIEAERGAITVDQYASLTIAMDNGVDADTLTALDLPRGALLPVQRTWIEKMFRNKELAERVREAVERATQP